MKKQYNFFKNLKPANVIGVLAFCTVLAFFYSYFTPVNVQDGSSNYVYKKVGSKMTTQNVDNRLAIDISNGSFSLYDSKSEELQSKFSLNKLEINDEALSINSKPEYSTENNKLTEKHSDQLRLNYTNAANGLRQDFVIEHGPSKDVEFNVELILETKLKPYQIDRYSIGLKHKTNDAKNLQYRDLLVYDANGKFLNAEMTFDELEEDLYTVNLYASADEVTYPITIDPLSTSDSGFESDMDSTRTGFAVTGDCDLNGDGFCDVVVGSYGLEVDSVKFKGKIDVFFGTLTGVDLSAGPDFTAIGDTAINLNNLISISIGSKFGFSLDCAGDVDGDTVDDLIVGAPSTSFLDISVFPPDTIISAGGFYIYYGGAAFGSRIDTFYGSLDTSNLGTTVAGLGDYTGNGFSDVAVSAPGYSPSVGLANSGAVLIYEGGAGALNPMPVDTLFGEQKDEFYGTALAGPGDIDGNGNNDLLIGAHNYTVGTDTAIGRVHMYRGEDFGLNVNPWEAIGEHKSAQFGFSVSGAGNFVVSSPNIDVLIGSNNYNPGFLADTVAGYGTGSGSGAVYVYSGNGAGLGTTPATLILNDVGVSGFGSAVSYAGRVDDDMIDDIIVGAPFYSVKVANEGAVYAYYGKNFEAGIDTTFDWCVTGERNNALFGTSLDHIGGCLMDKPLSSVVVGAYGYSIDPIPTLKGAAFTYDGTDCGLIKYTEPQFLTFPPDTIYADADFGACGANVSFEYPEIGTNCENPSLTIITGIDTSGFFPIGANTVTFRITSNGEMRDSSLVVLVEDTQSPSVETCPMTVSIEIPSDQSTGVIAFDLPEFADNHDCSGFPLTITKLQGVGIGTTQDIGVYPFVYSAVDSSGNVAYCTFRVVIRKVDQDGKDCSDQSIVSSDETSTTTLGSGNFEFPYNWSSNGQFNDGSFGVSLLLSMFESVSGISIPGWVKTALGELGSSVDLAFVKIKFNFLPELKVTVGAYYDLIEDSPLKTEANFQGQVCSYKPKDTFYGCRDTIDFTTSYLIDRSSSSLSATPGGLKQEMGVFIRDFIFQWPIFLEVSACIGVPLCIPFVGCAGCAGYTDSWKTPPFEVFEKITLLNSPGVKIPLIAVCDEVFEPGATIFTVLNCLGVNNPASDFLKELLQFIPVGPDNLPLIDPFFYDANKDEFVFDPNRVAIIGERIPEMDLTFGRLKKEEMGPSFVNGNTLTQSGMENRFFIARLDVFSLLYYVLDPATKESLICDGIQIGTQSITIGVPQALVPPKPPATCEIKPWKALLKIDVLDINFSMRSAYKVNYSFDPDIQVDAMKFRNSDAMETDLDVYWERENMTSGTGSTINNVALDEKIKIVVPDGLTDLFYVDNAFTAQGRLTGRNYKTENLDVDLRILEFLPSIIIPTGFGPVIKTPPLTLYTSPPRDIRRYNRLIELDNFNARVSMQPDNLPPKTVCRDTTLILDEFGNAFTGDPALYLDASSYDDPMGGTGTVIPVDVYPDTVYCSDYPGVPGFLVTRDDNCNFDTCEFFITLLDLTPPQLGCVDITVGIGENGTYIMNPDEVIIGAVDNCNDIIPTVTPSIFTCDDVGNAVEVTIIVEDIAGNVDSCKAFVTVVDTFPLLLECPYLLAYPVTRSTSDFACTYTPDNEEFKPTLVAPDCNTMITWELMGATTGTGMSNVGGTPFNLGETIVTYTATDASGNSTSCSFSVIVEDTVLPIISCRAPVEISTNDDGMDDYNCTTDYTWNHPNPSDNCSIIAYDVVYTNPDGTTESEDLKAAYDAGMLAVTRNFSLGTTEMKYTAVDTMDNMVMCIFTVTVIDDEAPMIFCENVTATNVFGIDSNVNIEPNDITTATINVPISMSITSMYMIELVGTQPDMGDLSFTLTSPQGTTINLFGGLCAGTSDFDAPLNDSGVSSITTASCGPLANGTQHMPIEPFSTFIGEDSKGDWILTMTNTGIGECGVLTDWALEFTGSDNTMGESVIELVTDADECSYTISDTGFDPEFVDNCDGTTATHDGTNGPFTNTLNGYELPIGETIIEWIVTDPSGNADTCEIIFFVVDNIAPTFLNCPMPDVVENAEFGECQAYANVALPIAEDNCGMVDVVQVDNTGLSPGSVFPVGTTILEYVATDEAGNSARCSVRIIINDTQLGSFACPNDINAGNDAGLCSATVTGISPLDIEDNCLDNNSIVYQIEYPTGSGNIVGSGVADASGEVFDEGSSTVSYSLFNQPVLMITEVAQEIGATEGGMNPVPYSVLTTDDYLEITNIGPAAYNVSGLEIERFGAGYRDTLVIPNTTIVQPGETLVVHFGNGTDDPSNLFFNIPCAVNILSGDPAGYAISYKGRAIDVTATNGFDPIGQGTNAIITAADWVGAVASSNDRGGIIRTYTYDNSNSSDWIVAENCYPLTIGALNPDLKAYSSNGTITGLQSIAPDSQTCSFIVIVEDTESPECKELADSGSYVGLGMLAEAGECNQSIINVPVGTVCNIQDINVSLSGSITGSEDISIYIISPQNDTVALYDKLCTGDFAVNVTFDDEAEDLANTLCGGDWSGTVRPQTGMLMAFYGSQLEGDWTLFVDIAEGSTATLDLTSWTLTNACMVDWQMDPVVLENDLSVCNAEYTWIHPYFFDNCGAGTITVNYFSDSMGLIVPIGGLLNNNFGKGGYEVTASFPVGTTTVEYTLVDAANNQSQCSFTVTVNDTELPVITSCPNDIFVALESGECEERVFYSVVAQDNCGIASIVYTPESGSYFPAGTTPVVVVVTDFAGNVSVCEFNVVVGEFEPSTNQLNCNNAINLSLDQNCEAVILADQILEGGSYGCFDDYCVEITTETGIPHDNYFSVGDINQTFIVSIIDCNGDSTNSCWGTVTIEEKFTPEIQCPADVTIACNQDPDLRDVLGILLTGEAFLLNCEPGAEIIYEDNTIDFGQCAEPRMKINRTWIVTDADGNQDACTQMITIGAINLNDIVFPLDLDLDKSLECFDVNLDASLTHPDSTGHPTINGLLVSNSGSLCMVSLNMTDDIFDICPGSYEILRTWKIRNMCLPISATNPIQHTQIIKVLDTTAPKMVDCPDDITLSVDPWGCNASGFLPIPQNIYDQCSDVRFSAAVYGGGNLEISGTPQAGDLQVFISNLRLGLHTIVYRTKDDCGNASECQFDINVVDNTPPTVIALQNIVVSITSGTTQEDGYAKLYVESLDNGSFDGCGPVKLEIRRETDLCDVSGNTTFNTDGHLQDGSPNPNSPNYDPDGGAYVKFCCEDLLNTDLDVNGDGTNDVGYVKVWLRVWDDGSDDGIFGNDGDQYNEAWAYVKIEDKLAPTLTCPADITITCADDTADLSVTGEAVAFGSCGTAPVEYNDIIINLSTCNEGFLRRRWNVVGRTDVFCDQTITLEGIDAPVSVSFAQVGDTEVSGCPDQISLGEPTWNAGPCDVIGYTIETDTFLFEDGACYKLVNTYTVINWCAYDPNNPFWEDTAGFDDGLIKHTQIVKVTDDTQPVIDSCENKMFAINDHDDSDADGIFCEAKLVLTNSATDPGSANCPTGWLKWQVFVDLWGDGTDDLEYSSYLPPFDSQFNDTNSNGIPDRYVAPTSNGETISIPLPDIEGSMSNHKVRWIVSDGCQNNTSCETEFMVVDKKAPTPYCIDISSAVMENDGTVSIWAIDFNLGSYDNCSSEGSLRYTFTETAPEDDPLYDEVSRSSSRIFNCDDVENSPVEVNMYVWDEKGNSDFCLVYFTVIDNNGTCGEGFQIAGRIATEEGLDVSGVEVTLQANLPEYPRVSLTEENGAYSFLGVSANADFELRSVLASDHRNGVSTLDLVKIQRHVLGLELLDSPYKVFAADVTGDEKLKASDLLVLRKLILGVINEFPTNESWRFVDKTQEFEDIYYPWPIQESIDMTSLQGDILNNDFIAVKIGDVNGNADPNFDDKAEVQTRDLQSIGFEVDDLFVSTGETVEVTFVASENFDLRGYQFSMELDGLTYKEVSSQVITVGEDNVGRIANDLVTMSYNEPVNTNLTKGSELFTIMFVANRTARISEMMKLTSTVTVNEAYVGDGFEVHEVELRFNESEVEIANALYQNEPNPFRKSTKIRFDLATTSDVTLTFLNTTGSVIQEILIHGKKGKNMYEIEFDQLGVNGLFYYQLKSGDFSETKKMILVK